MQQQCVFVCIDDKHRVKTGEPNYSVASAERGRQVIVGTQSSFQAADHDFTTFSIIPSVVLINDIPEEISGSWYDGQVCILFKAGAFEHSSSTRHCTELGVLLQHKVISRPVLFDGGPDHRLTYLSVKLSLIALFLKLDLDYLCAARTAPYHSYRNPVERIMSIVNLGLQAVALAREKMPEEMEKAAFKCHSLKMLRQAAEKNSEFQKAALDSIAPVKILLTDIIMRLELKGKNFQVFSAASAAEIDSLWSSLLAIDHEMRLRHDDKITAKDLSPALADFMAHCCKQRHYFFDILKCGKPECMLCKPLRLSASEFSKLSHLPDPTPGTDGHYKPFQEVFEKPTTEEHRPSAKKASSKATLPFRASIQHVHNAGMMLQCDECALWRLVYA